MSTSPTAPTAPTAPMAPMAPMAPASWGFSVSGRVQGVGFRAACRTEARRLGLRGWVANQPDGRVRGVACGETEAVRRFADWLQQGPPAARVDSVQLERGAAAPDETDFVIR